MVHWKRSIEAVTSLDSKQESEICRLAKIEVDPSAALYTKPADDKDFVGTAQTNAQDQSIVPIAGVYNWEWQWMPADNPLFEIPKIGTPSTTPNITITSTNVEGHIDAVAQSESD